MANLHERNALPSIGPRFFRADDAPDGEVMFEFVIDATNVIGPRPATKADSEKHPEAWSRFTVPREEPEEEQAEAPPEPREPEPAMKQAYARLEQSRTEGPPAPKRKAQRHVVPKTRKAG